MVVSSIPVRIWDLFWQKRIDHNAKAPRRTIERSDLRNHIDQAPASCASREPCDNVECHCCLTAGCQFTYELIHLVFEILRFGGEKKAPEASLLSAESLPHNASKNVSPLFARSDPRLDTWVIIQVVQNLCQ